MKRETSLVETATAVSSFDAAARLELGMTMVLTWRYLPAAGGFGHPAVNTAVTYPSESNYTEVLVGEGTVDWQQLTWEQNPTQFHIVNALAGLPVLLYLPAMVTRGSANLHIPERRERTLG